MMPSCHGLYYENGNRASSEISHDQLHGLNLLSKMTKSKQMMACDAMGHDRYDMWKAYFLVS
jgi:hypothetical protein